MFLNSKLAQLANREVQGPQFREFTFWSCELKCYNSLHILTLVYKSIWM